MAPPEVAVAAPVAVAVPPALTTVVDGEEADPTTTLELSSSLDQEAPTTLDTETSAHSDALSTEDAEPKLSVLPPVDGPSGTGSGPFSSSAASVAARSLKRARSPATDI